MESLRAGGILAIFLLATLVTIPLQWAAVQFRLPYRYRLPLIYHAFICRIFGIRIKVLGTPVQDRGVLMASNHASWLDMPILSGIVRASFVAKSEVATWPFFGMLAKLQQTVFVDRNRRSNTASDRDQIRERILAGDALVLFPEGTSSDGNRVLTFKSALLSAAEIPVGSNAVAHHVPVQPVSIAYVALHGMPMGRENRPFFAWYGDMDLVPHLWEALATGPIDVVVEFHEPLTIDAAGGRKQLAQIAETTVRRGVARALAGIHRAPPPVQDDEPFEDEIPQAGSAGEAAA